MAEKELDLARKELMDDSDQTFEQNNQISKPRKSRLYDYGY